MRVLIVDDEEELVRALVERLRLRGIAAEGVTSGREAIEAVGREAYDVAVVDVKMPGLGGLKVAEELRGRRPQLEVIFLTGHGSEEDAEEGRRLGAFDYVMKPVSIDALLRSVTAAAARGGKPG
ncbi:MAG: response regulator [Deltaproteobacteria bacterium]|nr:response regulator [Deltaproteobacteria bacterium]